MGHDSAMKKKNLSHSVTILPLTMNTVVRVLVPLRTVSIATLTQVMKGIGFSLKLNFTYFPTKKT